VHRNCNNCLASRLNTLSMLCLQEENQYLACPPEIAREMPPALQELVGYTMAGEALGCASPTHRPAHPSPRSTGDLGLAHSRSETSSTALEMCVLGLKLR
jgi:hypothetical protein